MAFTICNALENKEYCPALFLDISQAFDRVWIPGLLSKISSYVPKQLVLLVESYLHQRNFYVAYGEAKSAILPINAGVPQGSVLGPLLYLLYTADLPVQPGSTVATYADDTAILTPHTSYETATELLQNSAREVEHWAHQWKIKLNSLKSARIDFALRKHGYIPSLPEGSPVPNVSSTKYLGIHLDTR